MKKLKKILIALAVLALLISSVTVLIVTAEDEVAYTGDLAKAQELLDKVPDMNDGGYTTTHRKDFVKAVHNYLRQYPIDPATEGYAEFKAELDDISLKVLNKLYDNLLKAEGKAKWQEGLTNVYTYFQICPIPEETPDPDGSGKEYISYKEIFDGVESYNLGKMTGYYNTAVSKLSSGDLNAARTNLNNLYTHVGKWPLANPKNESFVKLYADYNLFALELAEGMISDLMDLKAGGDREVYKSAMQGNLQILRDHLEKCPIDLETFSELSERYEAMNPAINVIELDQIVFLFEDFENFVPDDATMPYPELAEAAALAKVSKALADSSVPEETEGYADLVARIAAAEERLAAVKEDRRLALAELAEYSDYALTNSMSVRTFSSDSETMGNPNADAGEYSERIKTYDNGMSSGYEAYWRYTYSTGREGNTNYASLTQTNILNGYVHSFDMMVEGRNGQHFKGATFSNEWTGKSSSDRLVGYDGTEFSLNYDEATDSLKLSTGNGISPAVTVKNIAAEGQWFNLTIVYDPDTHYADLYVDYQYVFTFFFNNWVENAKGTVIRISHSADWQYVCYDNIIFYEGTAYRDIYKFDKMDDNEKFSYLAAYALSEENSPKSRKAAYDDADKILDAVKANIADAEAEGGELDSVLAEAKVLVELFEAFDYDGEILTDVKATNLAKIVELAKAIEAISPDSSTASAITSAIKEFEAFISENNDYIDKSTTEYNDSIRLVNDIKLSLNKVEYTKTFLRALIQFNRATTVASMTRRANTAAEVYALARYDKEENRKFAERDPLFAEFEASINPSDVSSSSPKYITTFEFYEMIPEIIAAQLKVENSNRIIKCVELLLQIEGYEDTEEFWLANYDELDFYIDIIRDIVSVDNYDPTYPGIDEALLQYNLIDAYFFVLLQEEHKAIIGAQLDRFAESNSYIEKIGICTYLDRYFATNNDIDLTLPEVQEFIYKLERYKAELEIYMDDYKDLLERNTQYFVDTLKKMSLFTDYADLKPLYDEALSYYYAMNADTEEAKEAVRLFDYYDELLSSIEINSQLFISVSVKLDLLDYLGVEEEFAVLSDCARYYDYIDVTYSANIASRVALYEQLAVAYTANVDAANVAVDTAADIVAALRSTQIPASILAVISQLCKN